MANPNLLTSSEMKGRSIAGKFTTGDTPGTRNLVLLDNTTSNSLYRINFLSIRPPEQQSSDADGKFEFWVKLDVTRSLGLSRASDEKEGIFYYGWGPEAATGFNVPAQYAVTKDTPIYLEPTDKLEIFMNGDANDEYDIVCTYDIIT